MQLRLQHVSQLGQVQRAIIEPSGEVSVYCYPAGHEVAGLPILPTIETVSEIEAIGDFACTHCGTVARLTPAPSARCSGCGATTWTAASTDRRVT
jgi:hypothetical protein